MQYRPKITVASTISVQNTIKLGGGIAVEQLYKALAKYCDLEFIYVAEAKRKGGRNEIVPGLIEIVVPKTRKHAEQEKQLKDKLGAATAYDLSLLTMSELTPDISVQLKKSIPRCDYIVTHRFYLHNEVMKLGMGKRIIHQSQNVEYIYKKSLLPDTPEANDMLNQVFEQEALCCAECDLTFPCTLEDLQLYHDLYNTPLNKLSVLPCGVNCKENRFVSIEKRKKIKQQLGLENEKIGIFIGGGHLPNIRACEEILEIAPQCPDGKFFLIGPVCEKFSKKRLPKNLGLLGTVSEETRKLVFSVADFALNPMRTGSGFNIKMSDYMAMGVPVISTSFGARGIPDDKTYILSESIESTVDIINKFDLTDYDDMTRRAREMTQDLFDWDKLARDFLKKIV